MANRQGVFYHNLATMLDARVLISRVLQTAQSGFSRRHKHKIAEVIERIRGGDNLAVARKQFNGQACGGWS